MNDIAEDRRKQLSGLEDKIGYSFKKIYLLNRAVTHSSYANEFGLSYVEHNERLEFLGDSVLGLVISEYIFKKYRNKPEGTLTRIRASIVCEPSLYEHAKKINLGSYMLVGKGEETTGGRKRISILADAYEALIASIYIDGGIPNAQKFIVSEFSESIDCVVKESNSRDYKSRLQEYIQQVQGSVIRYEVTDEQGPPHNKTFFVNVLVDERIVGSGNGRSKKEAEQEAAKYALSFLGDIC